MTGEARLRPVWAFPSVSQQSGNNSSHRPLKETESLHVGDRATDTDICRAPVSASPTSSPKRGGGEARELSEGGAPNLLSGGDRGRAGNEADSRAVPGLRGEEGLPRPRDHCSCCFTAAFPGHKERPPVLRRLEISTLTQNPAELGPWHRGLHVHKPPHSQGVC